MCYRNPWIFGLVLLMPLSACGRERATVKGKVTYQGEPVTFGEVIIRGEDGGFVSGPLNEKGEYEVKGVSSGKAYGAVLQRTKGAKSPADIRREWKSKGIAPPEDAFIVASPKLEFPAKYCDTGSSGLFVDVTPPVTQFDLQLLDDPENPE